MVTNMLVTITAADLQQFSDVAKHDRQTSRSRGMFIRYGRMFLQALFRSFRCQVRAEEKDSLVWRSYLLGSLCGRFTPSAFHSDGARK